MLNDKARQITDKELAKLERALHKAYQQAYDELKADWDKYLEQFDKDMRPRYERMQRLKNTDHAEYLKAKKEYQKALREHTLKNKHFKQVRDSLAERLAHIDKAAYELVNGKLRGIYAVNYNALAGQLQAGYAYGLITPQTVRNLVEKELDLLKAVDWNKKLMNAQVLQGILRGESMDEIAARFAKVFGANEIAAIRNARTAVTYAENQGRLDSYYEAQAKGTVLVKVWSAAHDSRTRDSHLDNDRVERPLDEPFPNGQQCPGDQSAPPHEYMNCRCAMGTRIIGFKKKDGSIVYV